MRLFTLLLLLVLSFPCAALYDCEEHGRINKSSAPCDTTWTPLARYEVGSTAQSSTGSITLHLDRSNSYTIQEMVQGYSALFIVDTGASRTSVSARVAAAASLSQCVGSGVAQTANGSPTPVFPSLLKPRLVHSHD